jgi:pseudaminic acid biosynthesis-associated methylase
MRQTEEAWVGKFGDEYTLRNKSSDSNVPHRIFLSNIPNDSTVLEIGCNVGNQLKILNDMGFHNLSGIDVNKKAIEIGKKTYSYIHFYNGSLFELPFDSNSFDLVFTSGTLIHVNPEDLKDALSEIYRCSKKFIYGYEYYLPFCKGYDYREEGILVWRNDFLKLFLKQFPDLTVIKKKFIMRNFRDWRRIYLLRKKVVS